jgi:hypothetical protein
MTEDTCTPSGLVKCVVTPLHTFSPLPPLLGSKIDGKCVSYQSRVGDAVSLMCISQVNGKRNDVVVRTDEIADWD